MSIVAILIVVSLLVLIFLFWRLHIQLKSEWKDILDPFEEYYYEQQEKPHIERDKKVIGQRPLSADTPEC